MADINTEKIKHKILVADDESHIGRVLVSSIAKKTGYETRHEPEGEQALYRMRLWKPHLVFLDLYMPKKDGFAVLEERKGDSELSNIPIIVLSSQPDEIPLHKAKALGADACYHKESVDLMILFRKMEELLTTYRQLA
tara:strand:- start:200 stop:613 length:414 start_codon:yes stop_codon:yes gene_type:complete